MEIIWLSIGAIPGGLIRWQLNDFTLSNILGTMLLGFLSGVNIRGRNNLILGIGFCGALTTFSGWIYASTTYIHDGFIVSAIVLIFSQLLLGSLAALIGMLLAKFIILIKQTL